jgi:hypothetical protein
MVQLLFCFSSKSRTNISKGIEAGRWAVRNNSPPAQGKARRHFRNGSFGLLYCSEGQFFTTPFVANSTADLTAKVDNIWDETWYLPFEMRPLGDLQRQMPKDLAERMWRAPLIRYVPPITVFSPIEVDDEDWRAIRRDLGNLELPASL